MRKTESRCNKPCGLSAESPFAYPKRDVMLPFDKDEVRQQVELLCLKRHNVFYGICRLYFAVAVINIDQFISVTVERCVYM